MSGHQQQQTIYTIHEQSQLNNNGQRNSNSSLLIDTSSIPMSQQAPMPPLQHHHQLQPAPAFDSAAITSQPLASGSGSGAGSGSGTARVAPEEQNVVYSVHPIFSMLDKQDALLVRQRADPTATCCGFESVNTYTVRTKTGAPILKAIENSNCCERCCFEANREFNLSLVSGEEVVARIRKAYRVSRFCCYSNSVRIESPEDNPVGHIRQMFSLFGHPRYAIYDCQQPPKKPSFYLESTSCRFCFTPCLCTCVCGNRQFRIISAESREQVGTISREWAGEELTGNGLTSALEPGTAETEAGSSTPEEPFNSNGGTNNNTNQPEAGAFGKQEQVFGVQFENNLEARHKVLLLSACFMMDFFYFENDRRRRKLASC